MESLRTQLIEAGAWPETDARDPSADLVAAYDLRQFITSRNLEGDYERALLDVLEEHNRFQTTMYDLVFASPYRRCEAMLRIIQLKLPVMDVAAGGT